MHQFLVVSSSEIGLSGSQSDVGLGSIRPAGVQVVVDGHLHGEDVAVVRWLRLAVEVRVVVAGSPEEQLGDQCQWQHDEHQGGVVDRWTTTSHSQQCRHCCTQRSFATPRDALRGRGKAIGTPPGSS
jgi:hypothetical protein